MTSRVLRYRHDLRIASPDGLATREFLNYIEDQRVRSGGNTAMTNIELEAASNSAQATADAAQVDATQALVETAALRAPSFVVIGADSTLESERVLTAGSNIAIVDSGAGAPVSISLTPNITGSALNMTVQPLAPSATSDGGVMTVKAQNAIGAIYNGGQLALAGGNGGASAVGGAVVIDGGDGSTGGAVQINGGTAFGSGSAGSVEISAGDSGSGFGGSVNVYAGDGGQGGQFYFTAGAGVSTGGDFNVVGGEASGSGGAGGSVYLNAGNATAGGGSTGGNLYLTSGAGETNGGSISLFSALAPTATIEVTDDGSSSLLGLHGAAPVAQDTGWGAPTGTATKTTFNTATVTTAQLAERVKALLDYLIARGDIGP